MTDVVQGQMAGCDTHLYGRRSYELFRAVFTGPKAAHIPHAPLMNEALKIVVSTTLSQPDSADNPDQHQRRRSTTRAQNAARQEHQRRSQWHARRIPTQGTPTRRATPPGPPDRRRRLGTPVRAERGTGTAQATRDNHIQHRRNRAPLHASDRVTPEPQQTPQRRRHKAEVDRKHTDRVAVATVTDSSRSCKQPSKRHHRLRPLRNPAACRGSPPAGHDRGGEFCSDCGTSIASAATRSLQRAETTHLRRATSHGRCGRPSRQPVSLSRPRTDLTAARVRGRYPGPRTGGSLSMLSSISRPVGRRRRTTASSSQSGNSSGSGFLDSAE